VCGSKESLHLAERKEVAAFFKANDLDADGRSSHPPGDRAFGKSRAFVNERVNQEQLRG